MRAKLLARVLLLALMRQGVMRQLDAGQIDFRIEAAALQRW